MIYLKIKLILGGKEVKIRKIGLFIVLGLVLWLQGLTALAASETHNLLVETKIGINDKYKSNRYVPIMVTITNTGKDFTGTIQIVLGYDHIDYLQKVDIPSGTTKSFRIPIWNSDNYYDETKLNLLDARKKCLITKPINLSYDTLDPLDLAIGVLTEDSYKLNYLSGIDLRLNDSYQTQSFPIEAESIDENVKNIDVLDLLVINHFNTSSLLPEQLQSIESWVEQGGTLILGTGDNGKKVLSGFDESFLSVQMVGTYPKTVTLMGESMTLSLADIQMNEKNKVENSRSIYHELYQVVRKGAGTIIMMNYDLGVEPMAHFSQNKELWKRILVDEVTMAEEDHSVNYWRIENSLSHINNHHLLSAKNLFIILGIYIILVGVVSYFVLRKKQKKEWIWIVAPILALLTTSVIYFIALPSRLAPYVANQLDIVWTDTTGLTQRTSYASILNSQGKKLKLTEPEDSSIHMIETDDYSYYDEDYQKTNKHFRYENGKMHYQAEDCGIYDTTFIMSEPKMEHAPLYTYTYGEDNNIFQLTNTGNKDIERLFLVDQDYIWDLGKVEIGKETSINMFASNPIEIWKLSSQFGEQHELAYLGSILEILQDWRIYSSSNSNGYISPEPVYVAVTKLEKSMPLLDQETATDFSYQLEIVELSETQIEADGVFYPYDYFIPEVIQQIGTGYVDESGPVATLNGDITVDLIYTIATDCLIEEIDVGFNEKAMSDYYYNSLNGNISIYNFSTESYEDIKDINMWQNKEIGQEALDLYVKEGELRIRIVGLNEESGLVPSIAVKGTAYVKD